MSRSATELGKFCGNKNPAPITSAGNELEVTFISDDVIGGRGFRISYIGEFIGVTSIYEPIHLCLVRIHCS